MNKAFIFDFDGIIVNSEPLWEKEKPDLYTKCFGTEIASKLGSTLGSNLHAIHAKAVNLGATITFSEFHEVFLQRAEVIYQEAATTPDLDQLKNKLHELDFKIGIVSASPTNWITIVLKRLGWSKEEIDIIVSLFEREDLAHKPSPEGYLFAMDQLNAIPQSTLVLEDSNLGIASAKASGATTIGFKQNLITGYTQEGADLYAENIHKVITIVEEYTEKFS